MTELDFTPTNALEQLLLDAQQGSGSSAGFFDALLDAPIFVLIDKELGPDGRWDPSINLCILTNADGAPMVAAFTAPERSAPWHERFPEFPFGLQVSFTWLLQGLGPDTGIVVNPGWPVGVELAAEAIARLKQDVAGS